MRGSSAQLRHVLRLLLLATLHAAAAQDDTCADNIPASYLQEILEPQGRHKLADPGTDPMVSTKLFPPGNTLGTGLWECTPGTWSITRTNTEAFLVLAGRATLTNADGTPRVSLEPGVWHTTPNGWRGKWEVTETVRKLFIITP